MLTLTQTAPLQPPKTPESKAALAAIASQVGGADALMRLAAKHANQMCGQNLFTHIPGSSAFSQYGRAEVDPEDPNVLKVFVTPPWYPQNITIDFVIGEPMVTNFEGVKPGEKCWVSLTEGFGWYEAEVGSRAESLVTSTSMRLGEDRVLTLRSLHSQMPVRTRKTKLWYATYDRRLARTGQQDPFLEPGDFQYENKVLKFWLKNKDGMVHICSCHVYSLSGESEGGAETVVFIGGPPHSSSTSSAQSTMNSSPSTGRCSSTSHTLPGRAASGTSKQIPMSHGSEFGRFVRAMKRSMCKALSIPRRMLQ